MKFAKECLKNKKEKLVHGVIQKGGCGVPSAVNQEEINTRMVQACVQVKVKAAVIEGEPDSPNIVVSSFYNVKPIHFMSSST